LNVICLINGTITWALNTARHKVKGRCQTYLQWHLLYEDSLKMKMKYSKTHYFTMIWSINTLTQVLKAAIASGKQFVRPYYILLPAPNYTNCSLGKIFTNISLSPHSYHMIKKIEKYWHDFEISWSLSSERVKWDNCMFWSRLCLCLTLWLLRILSHSLSSFFSFWNGTLLFLIVVS
jgi:hypothetical protein